MVVGLPFGYKAGKEQWDKESYKVVGSRTIGLSLWGRCMGGLLSPQVKSWAEELMVRAGGWWCFCMDGAQGGGGWPVGLVHVRKGVKEESACK